jgi:hypothetical protein
VALAAAGCSSDRARTVGGSGLELTLPDGWHGLAAPGQVQAADFLLARTALGSANAVRVRRGHVHLSVRDYGPVVPFLAHGFPVAKMPLVLRRRDLLTGGLEGIPPDQAIARRDFRLNGEQLEVFANLGPKPVGMRALRATNRLLATLRVSPPQVIAAHDGRLSEDGLSLTLAPGWTGRIELPANRSAARLVLRAARERTSVMLMELPRTFDFHAREAVLPIAVSQANRVNVSSGSVARRVFSTNGRNFDLSVAYSSERELEEVSRLLAGLRIVPRPWVFRACGLSIRLPGTWTAGVRRRSGCRPIVTLRTPGLRIVVTRIGGRFRSEVTPRSRTHEAAAVLAGLRATPTG